MRGARMMLVAVLVCSGCEATTGVSGAGLDPSRDRSGRDAGGPGYGDSEICDNGADDDGDGEMDEGCGCSPGATQACWPGAPADRGMGECSDGVQTCAVHGEFAEWGPCVGATLPREGGSCCAVREFGLLCADGKDNDCDSILDCGDSDCSSGAECGGPPDDGGDSLCTAREIACGDGRDEDCDGTTDCADAECAGSMDCGGMCECVPGVVRWCDTPEACSWGKQTCAPDGSWGHCVETDDRPGDCAVEIFGWVDPTYDTECCISTGECCQNYPGDDSVGCPPPMCG